MLQGKATAALKFLDNEAASCGIVPLTPETLKSLKEKHPSPGRIQPFLLLNGPIDNVPSAYFDCIDEEMIYKAAMATRGRRTFQTGH